MRLETIFWIYYILCLAYCIYKLNKQHKKVSLDGVTGFNPGLSIIFFITLCYIIMPINLIIIFIQYLKKKKEKKEFN